MPFFAYNRSRASGIFPAHPLMRNLHVRRFSNTRMSGGLLQDAAVCLRRFLTGWRQRFNGFRAGPEACRPMRLNRSQSVATRSQRAISLSDCSLSPSSRRRSPLHCTPRALGNPAKARASPLHARQSRIPTVHPRSPGLPYLFHEPMPQPAHDAAVMHPDSGTFRTVRGEARRPGIAGYRRRRNVSRIGRSRIGSASGFRFCTNGAKHDGRCQTSFPGWCSVRIRLSRSGSGI